MNSEIIKKYTHILLFTVLFFFILYFAKTLLIPVVFAAFFGMLLTPVCNKLETWGLSRGWAVFISVLLLFILFAGIFSILSVQIANFMQDAPQLKENAQKQWETVQQFIRNKFNVSEQKQQEILSGIGEKLKDTFPSLFPKFFGGFISASAGIVLTFVFSIFLLFSRDRYEKFFVRLSKSNSPPAKTKQILDKIRHVSGHYVAGRMVSVVFLMIMYFIGFLVIGLDNAFLLSFIAAITTIIPYIGPVIGGLFPFTIALLESSSFAPALWVIAVIMLVQFFDTYIIEPVFIGGEVRISPFFSLVIIILGGMVWGIAGMILFLPMLGMLKIIFDNVESLHPYGFLIGAEQKETKIKKMNNWVKDIFSRMRKK